MQLNVMKIIGAVVVINMLGRLLGFAREIVIGFQFGTSYLADSIITAYTIPTFLNIVVGGALTTAFISIYSKMTGEKAKNSLVKNVFSLLSFLSIIVIISLFVFTDQIISMLFPGFTIEERTVTKNLLYWMAPTTVCMLFTIWFSGILNLHNKFKVAALSTFINNAVFIVMVLLFVPIIGVSAYGLGAVIGSLLAIIVLYFSIKGVTPIEFGIKFSLDGDFQKLVRLAFPIMLGGATLQFYFLLHRYFASSLQDGAISALNYAGKLIQFPQIILITAVTTVIYPLLAKKVAENRGDELQEIFQKGLRWLSLLIWPIAIFIAIYSKEVITVVFEYGSFTKESTDLTAPLLMIFSLSMFSLAATAYVTRFFYAMERSVLPVLFSVISVFGINSFISIYYLDELGASAIALGTTVSSIVNLFLLLILAQSMLKLTLEYKPRQQLQTLLFYCMLVPIIWFSRKVLLPLPEWMMIVVGGLLLIGINLILLKVCRFPEWEMVKGKFRRVKGEGI
ncbi:murein biosynthesis integral membrane protein MurJ [Bacillus salitolerans]|uniref:Lipid II flippase n=1 Tax=Bacillus salitolerans TaxID=1437434 RepID=A0ABW4LNY7_9BACI